jgi:hypothetical protein
MKFTFKISAAECFVKNEGENIAPNTCGSAFRANSHGK